MGNAYNPARRIFQALRHQANAMADLRGKAQELVDAARRDRFSVDPASCAVTAEPGAHDGADPAAVTRQAQSYGGVSVSGSATVMRCGIVANTIRINGSGTRVEVDETCLAH